MAKNPGLRRGEPAGADAEQAKGRALKNAGTEREVRVERTGRRTSGRETK